MNDGKNTSSPSPSHRPIRSAGSIIPSTLLFDYVQLGMMKIGLTAEGEQKGWSHSASELSVLSLSVKQKGKKTGYGILEKRNGFRAAPSLRAEMCLRLFVLSQRLEFRLRGQFI